MSHTVPIATSQLCRCSIETATDNMETNVSGSVPVKLDLQKQAVGHSLLSPDLDQCCTTEMQAMKII